MSEEKKIIIDEDWKTQVLAEKEAQNRAQGEQQPAGDSPAGPSAEPDMPPASLEMLLSTLATEALVALGQIPHPATGERYYHPTQAKYFIDTIEVLRTKTDGNLTPDEAQTIESLLHQLKMAFVAGPPPANGPQSSASSAESTPGP